MLIEGIIEMTEGDKKNKPFPIQGWSHRNITGEMLHVPPSTIPWWLAEEAYKHYAKHFGTDQSLKRLAERGGFGHEELLILLRQRYDT